MDLALGLSHARRQALGVDPTYGHLGQLEHLAHRAVLAGAAVQGEQDRVVHRQRRQQRRVGVAHVAVHAGAVQRVHDPPAGAQRDVALVRQPPGEDQRLHAMSGAGVCTAADGRRRAVGPKVWSSSSSCSTTPASRRTPSRMRSGSGKQYDSRSSRAPCPSA